MADYKDEFDQIVHEAMKLHGHLGPFLVIGVRMGSLAKKILEKGVKDNGKLVATVRVPLFTPFSCIIDGIQTTTHCTIGNQRLRVEDSREEIVGRFRLQNSRKVLSIFVNAQMIKELIERLSDGTMNEELAAKVADTSEDQLFTLEKR